MKDCAQNIQLLYFLLSWSRLADPFARPFKDLIIASETNVFRAAVLSV